MSNRIVIHRSKNKAILIIISGLLLAVAGWLFLQYTTKELIGWSFSILSIFCLLFGVGTMFDRKPYIILSESGITEVSGIGEEIEWDAILLVDDFFYRGQYFIRLLVSRNYKPALIKPTWFYRFDRLYEKDGVKVVFMRMNFLEINSAKLTQFISKMIKADAGKRVELLNRKLQDW